MSDYLVDTSALIQAYIADTHSARVKTLVRTAYDNPPTMLHILDFGLVESANILWKRVVFHGLLLDDAKRSLKSLAATPLTVHPSPLYFERALEIGSQHQLSLYDSLYLAVAESLSYPLISDDMRQSEVALKMSITLKPITDFAEYNP